MSQYEVRKKNDDELKSITDEVVASILQNNSLKINSIILYGSYARGTADGESDIDLMVLCENSNEEADMHSKDIFRLADRVAFDNNIIIQTNVKNVDFFNKWVDDLPYYGNIKREGIVLYC